MTDVPDDVQDLLGDVTLEESRDALAISKDDRSKIATWLSERTKNPRCPVCDNASWTVGEHLLHGQVHSVQGLMLGGPSYPQAFAVCDNCFYVRTFMAIPMGLDALKPKDGENG